MTSYITIKHFLAIIIGFCLLLTYTDNTVFAKEVGIRLTPSTIQIHPQKNGMVKKSITVENSGRDPLELEIKARAFTTDKKGKILYTPEAELTEQTKSFLTDDVTLLNNEISTDSLTLSPGQKEELELVIDLKDIQNISEHTFSLFFISKNSESETRPSDESPIQTALNVSVGTALHVIVFGKKDLGENQLKITAFQTDKFIQGGPISFSIKTKNINPEYINIYGNISITNMFGQQIASIRIPNQLLAGTSEKILSGQSGKPNSIIWDERILIGTYKATAIITTNSGRSEAASVSFFAFPIRTVILILTALLIASFVIGQVRERVR